MAIMVFVGSKECRYQAEKTFSKPPWVDEIKTFDQYGLFLAELRRKEKPIDTVYICVPQCDIKAIRTEVRMHWPEANVHAYDPTALQQ